MLSIAVDAMGGDHFPKAEVEGVIQAVRQYPVKAILVGREEVVRPELDRQCPGWKSLAIEVAHASEYIAMEDKAAAVRTKKDSSLRVACRMVREGQAAGVVSAGNTGAVMATAKMIQGVVAGVERPALAITMPTKTGKPTVVLDVGANVDCTPAMLAQFAVMGECFSRSVMHVSNPRVGLLSIGEEEHKGNELTREATPLLKKMPVHFAGNVEGRDIFKGSVDVVVCDGFVGNVLLKVGEGVAGMMMALLKEAILASPVRKAGAMLAKGAFQDLKKRTDYTEYGGAPLLGLKGGVCIICHGSSNANAIKNAVRVAMEYSESGVNSRIEQELAASAAIAGGGV
ncbi:MAG: phosphate acyltransferase PlsX [Acidobacteria bacterium]|nr:phosphate acyltransferase PlsX [Acidobacteriota bacterium]